MKIHNQIGNLRALYFSHFIELCLHGISDLEEDEIIRINLFLVQVNQIISSESDKKTTFKTT